MLAEAEVVEALSCEDSKSQCKSGRSPQDVSMVNGYHPSLSRRSNESESR